jgi:hypothetical protein
MQSEMLNLVGGSGERPWSPKDVREVSYEDLEYTSAELKAFAEMPAGDLGGYYFGLIEIVPTGRCRKAAQLREIAKRRGMTVRDMWAAWEALKPFP